MNQLSYFPGCSLESTASDYNASIQSVAQVLGISLTEIEDWNCCGATAAHSLNHELSIQLAARNLNIAERAGLDMVVPCALCFNRLKTAEKAVLGGHETENPFTGSIRVLDLLDAFSAPEVLEDFSSKVVNPLAGLKVACYYGCQVNRPPKVTDRQSWENPMEMDRVVSACGAEPLDWPFKTDCCGASHTVPRPDLINELVGRLYDKALAAGADCFAVSCQMCQGNLDMYQDRIGEARGKKYEIPVLYFTELMGLAAGLADAPSWLKRHFTDPLPLLKRLGFLALR
jgi:heterodisulfide reductase subunit B